MSWLETYHPSLFEPTSIRGVHIYTEGNRVISRDIGADGSLGCIKSHLGTHPTPGHAAVFAALLADPLYMLAFQIGRLTPEMLEKAAQAYNLKNPSSGDRFDERPDDLHDSVTDDG